MSLWRTEKAQQELRPGVRTLGQKQRSLLLMADGRKGLAELQALFADDGEQLVADLLREGFLEVRDATPAAPPRPAATPAPKAAPLPPGGDQFEGRRSLATTRMFLFDLVERMFARRDAVLAARFRDRLREARDRSSMLAVSQSMLAEIAEAAGHERADAIADRIALLLPLEDAQQA